MNNQKLHAVVAALPLLVLAFGAQAIGCASGGSAGAGGGDAECTKDTDCKGDRVCAEGSCIDSSATPTTSSSNAATTATTGSGPQCTPQATSCAGNALPCCSGSTCVDYGGSLGQVCGGDCTSASDCTSGCCAQLDGGGGACAPASYCEVTAPCNSSNHCLSSEHCSGNGGWCTEYCSSTNQCGSYAQCVYATSGSNICFPNCSSNSDCAGYPGSTCQVATNVEGSSYYVCAF